MRRLSGHIGAEITGVDLSQPLGAQVVRQLRDAVLAHKVIFFRDQNLDHSSQIAFAHNVGELTHAHPHEDAPPEQFPENLTIDPKRYEQKYGKSFIDQYQERQYTYYLRGLAHQRHHVGKPTVGIDPAGRDRPGVRRRHQLEQPGRGLPGTVRAAQAVHRRPARTAPVPRRLHRRRGGRQAHPADQREPARAGAPVRVHPETREKTLYVNPGFTDHIVGLSKVESRRILELLYEHLSQPRFTIRFH